jgi:hypothetical protein
MGGGAELALLTLVSLPVFLSHCFTFLMLI